MVTIKGGGELLLQGTLSSRDPRTNHEEDLISTHQKNQSHTANHDSVFGCRTLALSRCRKRERRRSGRWRQSPAAPCSAGHTTPQPRHRQVLQGMAGLHLLLPPA